MNDHPEPSVPSESDTPRPAPSPAPDPQLLRFACEACREATDGKCTDVTLIDVRGLSPLTHYIVIGTGTSERQITSVGRDLRTYAKHNGQTPFGSDADAAATWLVLDLVDVMIHLFEPATRGVYDLESMWGDAPRIDWRAHLAESQD
jgi:ribosome-associated protein